MDFTPEPQGVAAQRIAQRHVFITKYGERLYNVEVVDSPAPLDPTLYPGWRFFDAGVRFFAFRVVA